ncbi:MAG: DNA primase noncatalytic subunit PriX [Desulfurococcaceae archaeon]
MARRDPTLSSRSALKKYTSVDGAFLNFVEAWFRGPGDRADIYREIFVVKGELHGEGFRDRGAISSAGLRSYLEQMIDDPRSWNIFMGIGYWREHGHSSPPGPDKMFYDRLSLDLDSEEDPRKAIEAALELAKAIEDRYGATPLVLETGFKGAHVVVPLNPSTDWEGYRLLFEHLVGMLGRERATMVDRNMLQWNRVDRVPLTWNVKGNEARFCKIVHPRPFTWKTFDWDELEPLDPRNVEVVVVEVPRPTPAKVVAPGRALRLAWVEEVIKWGLPDGRKRFMMRVLIPYLVNVLGLDDFSAMARVREFLENSCEKYWKCGGIYESWIRGELRRVREKGIRPESRQRFVEENPDLAEHLRFLSHPEVRGIDGEDVGR